MRALLAAIVILLIAAPGAGAQDVVASAAQALKEDPVYVDPAVANMLGDDDEAELARRIEASGQELHVAVLPASAGDPEA